MRQESSGASFWYYDEVAEFSPRTVREILLRQRLRHQRAAQLMAQTMERRPSKAECRCRKRYRKQTQRLEAICARLA